jgi:hypothetical protein
MVKRPPKCMTGVEFVDWTTANEWLAGTGNYASSPCVDCTRDWHRQQDAAGMCDGTPGRQSTRIDPIERKARRAAYARAWRAARATPRKKMSPEEARAKDRERSRRRREALRTGAIVAPEVRPEVTAERRERRTRKEHERRLRLRGVAA